MKKIKIVMSFAILLVGLSSCNKDEEETLENTQCYEGTWIQEMSEELQAWTTAALEYNNDPTAIKCNNYKSAITNYLNALDKIKKCVPSTSLMDFNDSIDEAKLVLSDIDC